MSWHKIFHSSLFCLVVNTKTETNETMQSEATAINAHKMALNKSNDLELKKYYPCILYAISRAN